MRGPRKRRVDVEAELPMALNQLASVPGSLGTVREGLRKGGERRTCWGALNSIETYTHKRPGQTRQGTWEGREDMGVPSRVVQQVTPPTPYFRWMTEFSNWTSVPPFRWGSPQSQCPWNGIEGQ